MAWSFSDTSAAESVIEDIKNGKIKNSSTAYSLLTQIMTDFPGTSIANKARILRDSL